MKKTFFKIVDQAIEMSRPLRTTRRGAIDCRSLDKIQQIIARDCEKSMEVKEQKQYFKCRVVSKSRKKRRCSPCEGKLRRLGTRI